MCDGAALEEARRERAELRWCGGTCREECQVCLRHALEAERAGHNCATAGWQTDRERADRLQETVDKAHADLLMADPTSMGDPSAWWSSALGTLAAALFNPTATTEPHVGDPIEVAPFVNGECDIQGCTNRCIRTSAGDDRWFPHQQTGAMRLCVKHRKEEFPRG